MSTLAALAAVTLTLGACSTGSTNDTGPAPDTSAAKTTPASSTTTQSSATETPKYSATSDTSSTTAPGVNVDGFRSNLIQAGYTCDEDDDCTRTVDGATYNVDFDADSVSASVSPASGDRVARIDEIMADIGVALGEYDFGNTTWTDIKDWTVEHTAADAPQDDTEATLGKCHLEAEADEDGYGVEISFTA